MPNSPDNRLNNPYNPKETKAGGGSATTTAFPGFSGEYQIREQFQAHLVEEDLVDDAESASEANILRISDAEGLYMIVAVDDDMSTLDIDTAATGGNLAAGLVYFVANGTEYALAECGLALNTDSTTGTGQVNNKLNIWVPSTGDNANMLCVTNS